MTTTTEQWRAAWHAYVDGLELVVNRGERARRDRYSPRARVRNDWRATPGAKVEWTIALASPDPVLDYVIRWETPSVHDTRRAAEGAVEAVRAKLKAFWTSRFAFLDEDWTGSDIPALVDQLAKEGS